MKEATNDEAEKETGRLVSTRPVEKRAGERRQYVIDFSQQPEMARGETIVHVDVRSAPGLTLTEAIYNGARAQVTIEDGEVGAVYHVVFTVETDRGSRLVGDGKLKVIAD